MRAAARAIFVLVNIVVSPVKFLSHPAGVLAYVVGARRRGVNPPDVLIKLISERVVRYGKTLPDHEVLPCSGLWNAVLGSRTKVVFQHRTLDDCIVEPGRDEASGGEWVVQRGRAVIHTDRWRRAQKVDRFGAFRTVAELLGGAELPVSAGPSLHSLTPKT